MTIALIAHDSKKELMVQFCTAYCRILSQHKLVATGTTGKMIAEATGLQVQRFLAGVQGGDQQIASRIACNEVDMLLFFRDPRASRRHLLPQSPAAAKYGRLLWLPCRRPGLPALCPAARRYQTRCRAKKVSLIVPASRHVPGSVPRPAGRSVRFPGGPRAP